MKVSKLIPVLVTGSILLFSAGCSTTPKEDEMAIKEAQQHAMEMERQAQMERAARMKAEEEARMAAQKAEEARMAAMKAEQEAEQAKRLFQNKLNK
ncbi:MAG: hypothetical protein HQL67_03980 [Magnetococcales bacterium]|nr:hypothetical protein [Magnetococcales bacterium]